MKALSEKQVSSMWLNKDVEHKIQNTGYLYLLYIGYFAECLSLAEKYLEHDICLLVHVQIFV